MSIFPCRRGQRGAVTIFVCIVLLLLMTVLVLTAYSLSEINLRAVSNVQVREEATAAANEVIEQVASFDFKVNPAGFAGDYPVDINADDVDDYNVAMAVPVCVRAIPVAVDSSSSVTLPGLTVASAWNTVWELNALATEIPAGAAGASVRVMHGVRVLLSDSEKTAVCP
jgi:hypothetical protein